jgi:hypothetical protein
MSRTVRQRSKCPFFCSSWENTTGALRMKEAVEQAAEVETGLEEEAGGEVERREDDIVLCLFD